MSTVNAASHTAVDFTSLTGGTSSTPTSSTSDAQDRFLKLLVTQMQNQDPLNPMDNAQVTTQIAQLNTVSGIDKLNTTLTSMAASFSATQSLQATNLIGHDVLVPGSSVSLQGGVALFGAALPQSVDHLKVSIQDAAGHVLHSMDVGAHAAGNVALSWDGMTDSGATAANGHYTLVLSASAAGAPVSATPLSIGRVDGVSSGASGVVLNLGSGQTAALGDVKQIM
jgi:flagellar basal-body rod modification protein FlgD